MMITKLKVVRGPKSKSNKKEGELVTILLTTGTLAMTRSPGGWAIIDPCGISYYFNDDGTFDSYTFSFSKVQEFLMLHRDRQEELVPLMELFEEHAAKSRASEIMPMGGPAA